MRPAAITARGISKRYTRGANGGWSLHGGIGMVGRMLRGQRPIPARQKPDTFWALDNISFDIQRGERVGIVGRNGAGKSTLLKVLSRVVFPTTGEALIRGRLTSLLEVGTGFNENLSGRENVYLNASIHGLRRVEIERRFDDIIDFAGVRPFLDTPVKRYSSGMQMRLAFAVAAHLDPDILLLDEVLAVGDLSFQQKCLERVEGLVSEGRTLVFVSHSLDAITRFCNRCLWIDGGRLRMDGPAEAVVAAYLEEMADVRPTRSWLPKPTEDAADPFSTDDTSFELISGSTVDATGAVLLPPGDDDARLLSVRVIGEDGRPRSSAAVDEPVGVELTFDVLRAGKNIQPSVHFHGAADQTLFSVAYTDPAWFRTPPPIGRHVTTVWVPRNLLNVGITHIAAILATPDPFEVHCHVRRAVSFNVFERFSADDATARGLFSRDFPGAVRPRLQWDTRRGVVDDGALAGSTSGLPVAEPAS
jgi:lipopolysaccharide transport system ATP-binding protein